ncbi:MAG: DUF2075 domain-containing protein [Nitrosopumilus sp.]|nr:DUF2075 domain-containing protein [Nitrosopumilus sp.]
MERSYYSEDLRTFLGSEPAKVLGYLAKAERQDPTNAQTVAWVDQIAILQDQLHIFDKGHIMFEYIIPRVGTRVDVVLIYADFVFVIEFKERETSHLRKNVDQCMDYALDLKHFHDKSHCASIVPILVTAKADHTGNKIEKCADGIYSITKVDRHGITDIVRNVSNLSPDTSIVPLEWEKSRYNPTPTIIEAAKAMCSNIDYMKDLTRHGAVNLGATTCTINNIIDESKKYGRKSICFVTGVPGSGKTLAGLRIVCGRQDEKIVMLSGNETLVEVIRESLKDGGMGNEMDGRGATSMVVHIPKYRGSLDSDEAPEERIIVFDEAQRAWNAEHLKKKMNENLSGDEKKTESPSDPELIIGGMDKHDGWAVIICLVGEGQEIHIGETGLGGWMDAVQKHPEWTVYHSQEMLGIGYLGEGDSLSGMRHETRAGLHLPTSIRSFKADGLAELIRDVLDCRGEEAAGRYAKMAERYPIVITRDIKSAKRWLRKRARGHERYGILASSEASRLPPHGIYVKSKFNPVKWFTGDKDDIRSSYYLESAATEFHAQGLELDWACLAWDANLRLVDGKWSYHIFKGRRWNNIRQEERCRNLINAHRVLMTRARQGMVIFVPEGDPDDETRSAEFYDGTYEYLRGIGFTELGSV